MDWACWRAGRRWARGWVRRQGLWACWRWAWVQAWARRPGAAGRACWACRARAQQEGVRGRAGGRCRLASAGVQRQAERAAGWASGSSAQGARQAGRAAAGRAGRAGRAGDGRQARGQAWRGLVGARGLAQGARVARPAWAWPGHWRVADWASWASFGALCTLLSSGSVFGPGSTRYFPESPNEHCSL